MFSSEDFFTDEELHIAGFEPHRAADDGHYPGESWHYHSDSLGSGLVVFYEVSAVYDLSERSGWGRKNCYQEAMRRHESAIFCQELKGLMEND
jgi:hypothetical protein